MFMAALLINVKILKQPRYSSAGEWINKLWSIQTMKYYIVLKINELPNHENTWRNRERQFLKQADKDSGDPEEEEGVQGPQGGRGLGPLRRRKEQFFSPIFRVLAIYIYVFFFRTNDYTTKQLIFLKGMFSLKLCTNDYITTMFPALGIFSSTF